MNDLTVTKRVHFQRGRRSRKNMREGEKQERPAGRVPRVSRLMAQAIRLDQLIRDCVVTDQAELARLGHVSRARLTQVMNLLCLAPEIQDEILFLPETVRGRDAITEKQLRPISGIPSWQKQLQMWRKLVSHSGHCQVHHSDVM